MRQLSPHALLLAFCWWASCKIKQLSNLKHEWQYLPQKCQMIKAGIKSKTLLFL